MTITLPAELGRFVSDQVAQGNYASPTDVVIAGLEMLREQQLIDRWPAEDLRREIQTGVDEADRGELAPFNPVGSLAEVRRQAEVGVEQMRRGQVSAVDPLAVLEEVEREFGRRNSE